jgi:hypothetical protein
MVANYLYGPGAFKDCSTNVGLTMLATILFPYRLEADGRAAARR